MKNKLILGLFLIGVFGLASCKKDLVDTTLNDMTDVTALSEFNNLISEGVSMAFFHASWCKKCEEIRPAVTQISENKQFSEVTFLEMNHDDAKEIFDAFEVKGFPQILFFKNGKEVNRLKGSDHSEQSMIEILNSHL